MDGLLSTGDPGWMYGWDNYWGPGWSDERSPLLDPSNLVMKNVPTTWTRPPTPTVMFGITVRSMLTTFRIGGDYWGSNPASSNDFNMSLEARSPLGKRFGSAVNRRQQQPDDRWRTQQRLARCRSQQVWHRIASSPLTVGPSTPWHTSWLVVDGFDYGAGTINASGGTINSLVEGIGWRSASAQPMRGVDLVGGWLRIGGNDAIRWSVSIIGASRSVRLWPKMPSIENGSNWTFGRGWYGGNFVDHIDGYMDNIRFSDVALARCRAA